MGLKFRFNLDDSLDVVGVHLVGGVVGSLMIALVGTDESLPGLAGSSGGQRPVLRRRLHLLGHQFLA